MWLSKERRVIVLILAGPLVFLAGCGNLDDAQKAKVRQQKIQRLSEKGCPAYLATGTGRTRFHEWKPAPDKRPSRAAIGRLAHGFDRGRSASMRVLLIGRSASPKKDGTLTSVRRLLADYGVPHDTVIAGRERIPDLVEQGVGRYQAIMFSSSVRFRGTEHGPGSMRPLLSGSTRRRLRSYERRYKIREVSWSLADSVPGISVRSTYGRDPKAPPLPVARGPELRLTRLGRQQLGGLPAGFRVRLGTEQARLVRVRSPAKTILASPRGDLAALVGRDRLVLTFDQNAGETATLAVFPGVLRWVTRGFFIGERFPILVPQIDDLLLANFQAGGGEYRLRASDLQASITWLKGVRRNPLTAAFTLDWPFNGSRAVSCDRLTQLVIAQRRIFNWTNHTYEHLNLDGESTAETFAQVTFNNRAARALGLPGYDPHVLVTGEHSGLHNRAAMLGVREAGVNTVASNASKPDEAPVRFDEMIRNPEVPQIMMVPRYATNLFDTVSTPEQLVSAYNDLYRDFWRRDLSFDEILATESRNMLRHTLRGDWGPFFLHQINVRAYDGRHSLLSDLLDRVFANYRKLTTQPLGTPTFARVADMMRRRADFMSCHPAGVVRLNGQGRPQRIRIVAGQPCSIPLTGVARGIRVGTKPRVIRLQGR